MSVESTPPQTLAAAVASDGILPAPGLPPAWDDFQNDRLIQRPIFATLRRAFDDWRSQGANWSATTPAVFCLRGRGGEGKSVLLRQLAAALRDEIKLSFEDASHDPRRFAKPLGNEPWLFVDELPGEAHGDIGQRWIKSLRAHLPRYIVTTATPAACEWLTRRYPKVLAWTIWDLPTLTAEEAATLAEKLGAKNLWRPGDTLEEFLFACQQGARLEESNAALQQALTPLKIERLPVVWAANALGLGAPASLLQPELLEAAKNLPLPVRLAADGLHLTTPRLALPLLREWLSDVAARLPQLAEGFEALLEIWLRDGQPQWASWFLRRLLHNEHFAAVFFARMQRKSLLREMYERHHQRHGGQPAIELLSAWLEIGNAFRLKPDPVADAADLLEKNSALPPTLVTDIWLHGERRKNPLPDRIAAAATKFFRHTPNDAGSAVLRLYREATHLPPALAVTQRWLEMHGDHKLFNEVFAALFERSYGHAIISRWSRQCLGLKWHGKAEGRALAKLLEHQPQSGDVRHRAARWLRPNVETPEAGAALLELLRGENAEIKIIHAALLWTANFPRHAATAELWRVLLKKHLERQGVRQIALEWIREFPELPLVATMLVLLARPWRNDPEFATLVCGWLAKHPEHEQTPELLEMLAATRLENIRAQMGQWLDAHPRHERSAQLLAAILSAGALDADWMSRAEKFLQDSGHPDALRPLRALLATKANEKIIALALGWLPKLPLPEQRKLAHGFGIIAANQPEMLALLLDGLRDDATLSPGFFAALAARLLEKRNHIQEEWLQRGFAQLNADDTQKFFTHGLAKIAPLPQPLSRKLATWLEENFGTPAYRQMIATLRQHPAQGRCFHSASMLPLKILADVLKP